jgi:hypothetical protein
MADRYDRERDWDRGRDWGRDVGGNENEGRRRQGWEWDRRTEFAGEGPRGGHEGAPWGREGASTNRERVSQSNRGDWGPQGNWGVYGNRSAFDRENEYLDREDPALHSARVESDWGGPRTGRTNLYGTGGGGFGTGMASYGAGMGNFAGTATYGGGMGRHAGRGPKGWQRSDDRIREDVNERLTDHPHIDASEIEVQVQNGEVTLSGTVEDRHAKRLAEDIADSVSGVRDVHNQIRVHQGETARSK